MKPTTGNIATNYGLNRDTISRYKNSTDPAIRRRYEAFKAYFENPPIDKPLTEMTREELFALHERISEQIQSDADTLQVIVDLVRGERRTETTLINIVERETSYLYTYVDYEVFEGYCTIISTRKERVFKPGYPRTSPDCARHGC